MPDDVFARARALQAQQRREALIMKPGDEASVVGNLDLREVCSEYGCTEAQVGGDPLHEWLEERSLDGRRVRITVEVIE